MRRVAIVGSRDYKRLDLVRSFISQLAADDVVISGGARGVDATAAQAARQRGLEVVEYLADWEHLGKRAGFERNTTIIEDATDVVAFWDMRSNGTRDDIEKAMARGKRIRVIDDDGRVVWDTRYHGSIPSIQALIDRVL